MAAAAPDGGRRSTADEPARPGAARGEWLQPGVRLACAVGANDGRKRELGQRVVLERATFVCCDSRSTMRGSSPADLMEPVASGVPRLARGARAPAGRRGCHRRQAVRRRCRRLQVERGRGLGMSASRRRSSVLLAESVDDVSPREHPLLLLGAQAVLDVGILRGSRRRRRFAPVLAQEVGDDVLPPSADVRRTGTRTDSAKRSRGSSTGAGLYSRVVQVSADRGRFAERVLQGIDDAGNEERVVIWIERGRARIWAVGRAVNRAAAQRDRAPRQDDYIFEGYDSSRTRLEQANFLRVEDDLTVSEADGRGGAPCACLPATSCSSRSKRSPSGARHSASSIVRSPCSCAWASARRSR